MTQIIPEPKTVTSPYRYNALRIQERRPIATVGLWLCRRCANWSLVGKPCRDCGRGSPL